jgi:hypothetical protein
MLKSNFNRHDVPHWTTWYKELPQAVVSDDYAIICDNHVTNKRRMRVTYQQCGVVCSPEIWAALPKKMQAAARRVTNWGGNSSPKTKDALMRAVNELGLCYETTFDAAHGRRYRLFVYPAHSPQMTFAEQSLVRGAYFAVA